MSQREGVEGRALPPLLPDSDAATAGCGDVRRALHRALRVLPSAEPPAPPVPLSAESVVVGQRAAVLAGGAADAAWRSAAADGADGAGDTPLCACAAPAHCTCGLLRRDDLLERRTRDKCDAQHVVCAMPQPRATPPAPPASPPDSRSDSTARAPPPEPHAPAFLGPASLMSLSTQSHPPLPASRRAPLHPAPAPYKPLQISPQVVEFINFVPGQTYKRTVRVTNPYKEERRVSVRPLSAGAWRVTLEGGSLAMAGGAVLKLRITFAPRDTRALRDRLLIRVRDAPDLLLPLHAYHETPMLYVSLWAEGSPEPPEGSRCADACSLSLGARLLGDTHHALLRLRSPAQHAQFAALSDESWLQYSAGGSARGDVDAEGAVRVGEARGGGFTWRPARWRGGGRGVRGAVTCRARAPGLHAARLLLLASTAAHREITLLADSLLYGTDHVELLAQEKDFDIMLDADDVCQYFVQLRGGGGVLRGEACGQVRVLNRSALPYRYEWRARAWRRCACAAECAAPPDVPRCARPTGGALQAADAALLCVEPHGGVLPPRGVAPMRIMAPLQLHACRAVLMLVLLDIPLQSIPAGPEVTVLGERTRPAALLPGETEPKQMPVVDVAAAQLEVWWGAGGRRLVLLPPRLQLTHSPRVTRVPLRVRLALLSECGRCATGHVTWRAPPRAPPPPPLTLSPLAPRSVSLLLLLPPPRAHPRRPSPTPQGSEQGLPVDTGEDEFIAEAEGLQARLAVHRAVAARHCALSAARGWHGAVPPGAPLPAALRLLNDTHAEVEWECRTRLWCGAGMSAACVGVRCVACGVSCCCCAALLPAAGRLPRDEAQELDFNVHAPQEEGACIWVVTARGADSVERGVGARGALQACRVLHPRVVLRTAARARATPRQAGATLDASGALLRLHVVRGVPHVAHVTLLNITHLRTTVCWELVDDAGEEVQVSVSPRMVQLAGYASAACAVRVCGARVCSRRLHARAATLCADSGQAHRIYLLIDVQVVGVTVSLELEHAVLRGSERPGDAVQTLDTWEPRDPEEIFSEHQHQRNRLTAEQCSCSWWLEYTAPPSLSPADRESVHWSQKPRVCACALAPAAHALSLDVQFRRVTLQDASADADAPVRRLELHNCGALPARWCVTPRRMRAQPRAQRYPRGVFCASKDGACLQVSPSAGALAPGARQTLTVRLLADTFGLYRDQLLLQVERVPPVVLDVWAEVVAAPLRLLAESRDTCAPAAAVRTGTRTGGGDAGMFTLWMSAADAWRAVCLRNTSSCALRVQGVLMRAHSSAARRHASPFRLLLAFTTPAPHVCRCDDVALPDDLRTGIALMLVPDVGEPSQGHYELRQEWQTVAAGAQVAVHLRARCLPERRADSPRDTPPTDAYTDDDVTDEDEQPVDPTELEQTPPYILLIRIFPEVASGHGWFRPVPGELLVSVVPAPRPAAGGAAPLLAPCCARAALDAMVIPARGVLRVRRRVRLHNATGALTRYAVRVTSPWRVLRAPDRDCAVDCPARLRHTRDDRTPLHLAPYETRELRIEAEVSAALWPPPPAAPDVTSTPLSAPHYPPRRLLKGDMEIRKEGSEKVEKCIPLVLSVSYCGVWVRPTRLALGFATEGDARRGALWLTHSAPAALELSVRLAAVAGPGVWQLAPTRQWVPAGGRGAVQARWVAARGADASGAPGVSGAGGARALVEAQACGACSAWCGARALLTARASRDHKWRERDRHYYLSTDNDAPQQHTDEELTL